MREHRPGMITDPNVPPPTLEEEERPTYTAIGYWNDADNIVITGIIRGEHNAFGGDNCSEGGPWAESFEAVNDEQAEDVAAKVARDASGGDEDDEEAGDE